MIHSGLSLSSPSCNTAADIRSKSSLWVRTAMRVSRFRWFVLLRRVLHYQHGSRSDLGPNPFNSGSWMVMELAALLFQLFISVITLFISESERPVWPMRLWIAGYDFCCALDLLLLFLRYRHVYRMAEDCSDFESSRTLNLMAECRRYLDLSYAIWFVVGNFYISDPRISSFERAPKLHLLCIFLLVWKGICYSFQFILFLLLCCCVPLVKSLIGYNMNMGSNKKGASDYQSDHSSNEGLPKEHQVTQMLLE